MKLLQSNNPIFRSAISRVLYTTTSATGTQISSTSSDSLYRRISPVGNPRVSIVPVLDQWIEEGRTVKHAELQRMIKQLRSYRRFKHALEMSEWMSNSRFLDLSLSPGDIAVRLDLISKVHGVEEAEKYFTSIPDSSRVLQVYGALLNCYGNYKSLEKAEGLMQKMKELRFLGTSLSYNVMLKLYSQMGKYEKLDTLMQEMEENGIWWDIYTYAARLNAFVAASDVDGMEKLLMKMEADPLVTMDWNCYVVAANGYLKSGLKEKASAVLRKSEHLIQKKSRRFGYEFLLTVYTSMGCKDEVYRIWKLCKNMNRVNNSGYLCMISSLVKLDDIDGAEKVFKDWESGHTIFDFRVPNLMVSAYFRKDLIEKAEALVNSLIEGGKEPNASTWDRLAYGYYIHNQMTKAVETMKKALSASLPATGWKPERGTFAACLKFMKENGNLKEADEYIRLCRDRGHISMDTFNRFESYINNNNSDSIELDEMGGGNDRARDGGIDKGLDIREH